ncbi:MAG: hypothetical protein LBF34_03275, partial [Puniceicoccales bacterium]|nr:hypothetical protein [Puniceicoccales bacterium]
MQGEKEGAIKKTRKKSKLSIGEMVTMTGRSVFPMAQREEKSGFLLIDSTPLPVCENVRANRHRTF